MVADAKLVFSGTSGNAEARDENPLRGLLQNRPGDYSLTKWDSTCAEVAPPCPSDQARHLERFSCHLKEKSEPLSKSTKIVDRVLLLELLKHQTQFPVVHPVLPPSSEHSIVARSLQLVHERDGLLQECLQG